MREDERLGLGIGISVLVVLVFAILAIVAGNIVNQLLAPIPGIAGPLGAAAALTLFIFLVFKTIELLFG